MALLSLIVYHFSKLNEDTVPETFGKMVNRSIMKVYHDPTLHYFVRYPSFFEQVPDSLINDFGCSKFRFCNVVNIEITTYILNNVDGLSAQQGMDSIGRHRHATDKWFAKDSFIISGPLYWENGTVSGHYYHAKYVRHQRAWFVQELTYPQEYEQAVSRLVKQIDQWNVWNGTDKVPIKPLWPKQRKRAAANHVASQK